MKYLLISDIHGSLPRLKKALEFYRREQFDMLIVLGDILNYGPRNSIPEGIDAKGVVETLNAMADEIVAIRGNCDAEVDQMLLDFPMMADYTLLVDEGKRILLTHGHVYNKEQLPRGRYDIVFYGHTHLWELGRFVNKNRNEEAVVCNTGSITFPKGGNVPTMASYEQGLARVLTLDGDVLSELRV